MSDLEVQIPSFDPFKETADANGPGTGSKDNVHVRIQQRNGRKSLTTVQGLKKEYNYNKILKDFKKEFCCNGTVVQDPELGQTLIFLGACKEATNIAFSTKFPISDVQYASHDTCRDAQVSRHLKHGNPTSRRSKKECFPVSCAGRSGKKRPNQNSWFLDRAQKATQSISSIYSSR